MSLKFETPITDVPLFHQGKVRDMYDLGDSFLMVASDRLSAFDVVLPTPITGKGKNPQPAFALLVSASRNAEPFDHGERR